ncbi:hypothetical protein JOM56_012920 [Amanita muscaria]
MSDSESDSSLSSGEPVPAKASPRAQQLVSDMKESINGVVNPDLTARLSTYHSVGRWIPVGINPFIKTKDIFLIGIWFRIGPIESHPKRMHLQQQKEESVRFELDCFDRIIQLIPDGLKILEEIAEVEDGIRNFIKYMHKKSTLARSDDTKALKKEIGRYLPYDWENDAIVLPVADGKNGKGSTRGFHHSACARNLCPRRLLDEFDMDPKIFMEKVLTGETKIRDKDFPSFLYDETIPYDPHNKDEGLLQGHVLIRAYRHIITGPKTALKPDLIKAKNSRCKSEKIVLTKSDRYTIAYTVYYSISAADNWGPVLSDGFNLQGLYNRVIHFLEDEKDSTVEDIMLFYDTECRFHELKHKEETKKSETKTDTDDELEEIKMTRRLRQLKRTSNDEPQLSRNNTPVDRDVVTIDPRLTVEEESQPNDFDNPGLSPYSGSQDFDFNESQDEIEANTSMGPATPMSGEPPNSIPDGLNRSQNFSIDPNSFFGFNPNGNFFVPHGINTAQAFSNGFVPNGFNLESLKALNSNAGLFYQNRSRHRRDNSEDLDSEGERSISQQVQGGASARTSRSKAVIPQSAIKAHPPNHSTMQQDESALARANEERVEQARGARRVEQVEQVERGAKRRKKAVAPLTDRVTRPRK